MLKFELTEDQRLMLDTVKRVRKDVIEPNSKKWLNGDFPYENMDALAEIGILGMAVPEEYGGIGASVLDTVLVLEEIAKGCYVTAMAVLGVGTQCRILIPLWFRGFERSISLNFCRESAYWPFA